MSLTVKFAQSLSDSDLKELREQLKHDVSCFYRVMELVPNRPTSISARARLSLLLAAIESDLKLVNAELAARQQLTI